MPFPPFSKLTRCVFSFIVSILLASVFASEIQAQSATPSLTPTPTPTGPIRMAIDSPFAQTHQPLSIVARPGKWFPVAVTLSNTGDEVSAEVRLRLLPSGSFDAQPNDFYAPVVLPTNSRKVVWLYGRLERGNVASVEVTLSGRGVNTLRAQGEISLPEDFQRVLVVVSDGNDGLADSLKGLRSRGLYKGLSEPLLNRNLPPLKAVEASRDLVPDRWIGFDGADSVILGDFPHISLAPLQLDALRGYAQGGGNLIVTGGSNSARLAASPLRDLWPVKPQGSGLASASQVANLVNRYVPNAKNGGDRLGGAPVALVRGAPVADAVLRDGTATQPLFLWRNSGAGRTLMLTYDPAQPPFKGWSGQDALWLDVLGNFTSAARLDAGTPDLVYLASSGVNPAYSPYGYNPNDQYEPQTVTDQLLKSLARAKQLRLPPVSQIAWFLALYIFFLVPVNYAVLRIIDRRELAWVTIPVIVIIFSVWAYSAAASIRGRAILTRQIDIVQSAPGASQGRVDSLFWLFSPGNMRYDLTSSGQNAVINDYFDDQSQDLGVFSILQPENGSGFKAESVLLRQWTSRAFVSQSLVDMKKDVSLSGTTLRNDTPFDLQGAVWLQDDQVRALGAIKTNSSLDVSKKVAQAINGDAKAAIVRAGKMETFFDASMRANNVPTQALGFALQNYSQDNDNAAWLIAWANRTVAPIRVDQARGTDVTLFVWRFAKLPTQLASREATVRQISSETIAAANNAPNIIGGRILNYQVNLPSLRTMKLNISGAGWNSYDNQGVATSKSKNISQSIQIEVFDPARKQWLNLSGSLKGQKSDYYQGARWSFVGTLNPALARQPDSVIKLKIHLKQAGLRVSSLRVAP